MSSPALHGPAAKPLHVLVVDDERPARANLRILLQRDADIGHVRECEGGAEALDELRGHAYDLAFLDVEMPECDGFDVIEMLGAGAPSAIVFVTAYDRYAIRAFEAGALDYVLKPFDDARFARTLERAKRRIENERFGLRKPRNIPVKRDGSIAFVKHADIDWIEAADYCARLHARDATHLLRRSLADLEADLDPAEFCRIHRSIVVRLERVSRLEPSESGEFDVVLEDGVRLPVSRRHRHEVQSRLIHHRRTGSES